MKKIILSIIMALGIGTNSTVAIPTCSIVEIPEVVQQTTKVDSKLETYVLGVVAGEMPVDFPYEALKAQAVAVRTYAYRAREENPNLDYTTLYQHYVSIDSLKAKWGKNFQKYYDKIKGCVDSTQGEILEYNDEPILAVFCSTTNGETENCREVWGQDLPYLKNVNSVGDKYSPYFYDEIKIDKGNFASIFGSTNISIASKSQAGYVKTVNIGGKTYSGERVRSALGLRSTDFSITEEGNSLVFTTKGYGHGVGMSQYGASYMANQGSDYREILSHYYSNTNIKKI